jgi:hypothetical protein
LLRLRDHQAGTSGEQCGADHTCDESIHCSLLRGT